MLDIRRIREDTQAIRTRVATKGADGSLVDIVVQRDAERRTLLTEVEQLKSDRNRVSKQIGALKREGKDTSEIQAQTRALGAKINGLDAQVGEVETALNDALLAIPNVPHASVPVGADESANQVVREHGTPPPFDFEPKTHMELGESLGLLDMPRAARMTGAGFALFTGAGSRLQRALINFMLDLHVSEHGYREIWPPALCNTASMTGTGQLPKMADDMYGVAGTDVWLIPTAEVPVTNYYREEVIAAALPVCLTAYTPCFRKEAGAAGKDTRGLIRLHQFDKVEMVKFVAPETSYDELEALVVNAEDVLQRLELPYRVIELCTGDLSFAAAKCYDIELWAPGQQAWLEVSSCSNFEDFQARRAGIRCRTADGKTRHVHTLNGSGVALPRLVVAILEHYQQADGTVKLPAPLMPYMNGMTRLKAAG